MGFLCKIFDFMGGGLTGGKTQFLWCSGLEVLIPCCRYSPVWHIMKIQHCCRLIRSQTFPAVLGHMEGLPFEEERS